MRDDLFIHETYHEAIGGYIGTHVLPALATNEEYFLDSLGFHGEFLVQCGGKMNFCFNETREEIIRILIRRACFQLQLPGYMLMTSDNDGYPCQFTGSAVNEIFTYANKRMMKYFPEEGHLKVDEIRSKLHGAMGLSPEELKLYYHGTNWENAFHICDGIDLGQGRPDTDFGMSSFYMSQNLKFAAKWALDRHSEEGGAIVIFALHPALPIPVNEANCRIYDSASDEWKQFTFQCRQRQIRAQQIEHLHLIEGPIVRNPNAQSASEFYPVYYPPDVVQKHTAIRSSELCNFFDDIHVLVVFFSQRTAAAVLGL